MASDPEHMEQARLAEVRRMMEEDQRFRHETTLTPLERFDFALRMVALVAISWLVYWAFLQL